MLAAVNTVSSNVYDYDTANVATVATSTTARRSTTTATSGSVLTSTTRTRLEALGVDTADVTSETMGQTVLRVTTALNENRRTSATTTSSTATTTPAVTTPAATTTPATTKNNAATTTPAATSTEKETTGTKSLTSVEKTIKSAAKALGEKVGVIITDNDDCGEMFGKLTERIVKIMKNSGANKVGCAKAQRYMEQLQDISSLYNQVKGNKLAEANSTKISGSLDGMANYNKAALNIGG